VLGAFLGFAPAWCCANASVARWPSRCSRRSIQRQNIELYRPISAQVYSVVNWRRLGVRAIDLVMLLSRSSSCLSNGQKPNHRPSCLANRGDFRINGSDPSEFASGRLARPTSSISQLTQLTACDPRRLRQAKARPNKARPQKGRAPVNYRRADWPDLRVPSRN